MSPEEIVKRIEAIYRRAGDDEIDAYNKAREFVRAFLASGLQEAPIGNTGMILYRKVSTTADSKAETQRLPPVQNPKKKGLFD